MPSLKNNDLLIYAGIGILVIIISVVVFLVIKKERYYYDSGSSGLGTAPNTLDLITDASGNLSTRASVPIYTIVAWYGQSSSIPAGWALCDGGTYNGLTTPDLTGKSLIGCNGDGNSGGSIQPGNTIPTTAPTIVIQPDNLPDHTHWYNQPTNPIGKNLTSLADYGILGTPINIYPYNYFSILWIMKVA